MEPLGFLKLTIFLECFWEAVRAVPSDCNSHLTSITKIIYVGSYLH